MLMSANNSLALELDENYYQTQEGNNLIEREFTEVSSEKAKDNEKEFEEKEESAVKEESTQDMESTKEAFLEETTIEETTIEETTIEETTIEETEAALAAGIDLHIEEEKAEHVPNDLTGVLSTYIDEKQKEVSVIYGDTVDKYTGESIDVDLSKVGLDAIDNFKMEFLLTYHIKESDNVDPADRYVQGGDYFYVNIPKYMEPHFEEGNSIDLIAQQDGEKVKVATAQIATVGGQYKIKITFTDAVGKNEDKALFDINFGCNFWLTFNKEQIQDATDKSEVIDVSGININITYPENNVNSPSKIEKTGKYIKADGKVLWTIVIDEDSIGTELQGWILTDEIDTSNQTLSAIYIKADDDEQKTKIYDVENIQEYPGLMVNGDGKFSYLFSNNEKTPYYIYVETKEKEEEILKPAFKTWSPVIKFTNKLASLSSEDKKPIEKENVQISVTGGNIFNKWDYVESANCIRWQIPVNDGLYHITKPVKVVDHLVKNIELIESKGVEVAGKIIAQKNVGDSFDDNEDAYYCVTDRLDENGEIDGKDLTIYYKAGALDGKSGGIKFYTRVVYSDELYDKGYQYIDNTADLIIEEYNLKMSATTQVKCKDVIGLPNYTGMHKFFVNKWGKFNYQDNTMFWSFQPTMVGGDVKTVKIYDYLDDKQTFIEDSLKIYVGSGAYLPINPTDRGIKVKFENKTLEIDFSESDITVDEFNTLHVTYSTNTNFGSKGLTEKKSDKLSPKETYYNGVVISDGKNTMGKEVPINVDSRFLQKDTATYYENDEIGFCYKITVNPNKAKILGGVNIEDKISDIKYTYYDSKEENKNLDISSLKDKAEFEVSKVKIYQDGKEIENVDFSQKDGDIKLHLTSDVVSNHKVEIRVFVKLVNANDLFKQNISVRPENTVIANVQMNDNTDEYTEHRYTDDSDVRLTQKKLEKKFEKQYVDANDKETYVDYSLVINSAGTMLGDVVLKDSLNSKYTEFDMNSVKLYKLTHDSFGVVLDEKYVEVKDFVKKISVNSSGEQQLTIEIKNCDDTYKLVYRVKILPEQKANSKLVNNAILEGKAIGGDVSDSSKVTIQLGKNGWANATTRAIVKVNKTDEDTHSALQGVIFALYKAEDRTSPISVKATDNKGVAQFYVNFSTSYVIVETQALEGYINDRKEITVSETDLIKGVTESKVYNITNKKESKTQEKTEPSTQTPTESPITPSSSVTYIPNDDTPTNGTPNHKDTTILDDSVPLAQSMPISLNNDVAATDESIVMFEDEDVPLAAGPKTGDDSNIAVWFWVMLLAFVVLGVSTIIIENKKTE